MTLVVPSHMPEVLPVRSSLKFQARRDVGFVFLVKIEQGHLAHDAAGQPDDYVCATARSEGIVGVVPHALGVWGVMVPDVVTLAEARETVQRWTDLMARYVGHICHGLEQRAQQAALQPSTTTPDSPRPAATACALSSLPPSSPVRAPAGAFSDERRADQRRVRALLLTLAIAGVVLALLVVGARLWRP